MSDLRVDLYKGYGIRRMPTTIALILAHRCFFYVSQPDSIAVV